MHRGLVLAAALAFLAPVAGAVAFVVAEEEPARAAAARPVSAAVQPTPAPRISFSGTTSQQLEIAFELAADGRRIEGLHVSYRAECGGKGGLGFELDDVFYAPVAVAADGTFSVTGFGKRLTFNGRIAERSATGTVRVDYEYGGLFRCTTPPLRWTASS